MKRTAGGYTIVEAMIVLAISALLFMAALVVISGQQGETLFSQSMQDLKSKLQDYVSQVNAGSFPDASGYTCAVDSHTGRPYLSAGSGGAGTNVDCIFLGRAIELIPRQSTIYIYTVLGTRDAYTVSGATATDTGQLATAFEQTNPEPANLVSFDAGGNKNTGLILVDKYTLPGDAVVSPLRGNASAPYSKVDGGNRGYGLIGLYKGLPSDSTIVSKGTGSLLTKAYRFRPNASNPQFGIQGCIEKLSSFCGRPVDFKKWTLCIQSSGSNSGQITVNSL